MTVRKVHHTIRELPTGWLHKEWGRTYRTATHANRAMDRYEREIVNRGGADAVVSDRAWEPTTAVGYAIARAVTAR